MPRSAAERAVHQLQPNVASYSVSVSGSSPADVSTRSTPSANRQLPLFGFPETDHYAINKSVTRPRLFIAFWISLS